MVKGRRCSEDRWVAEMSSVATGPGDSLVTSISA